MELTPRQIQIMNGEICPYCGKETIRYEGALFTTFECKPCKASVGVHKDTGKPLGRVAKPALRLKRNEAHKYFDLIWKQKQLTRKEAYDWLSMILNIPREYTHIAMFGEETCDRVVYHSKQILNDLRRLDLDFGQTPKTEYYEI